MAEQNWWESAPLAETPQSNNSNDDWYKSAPLANQDQTQRVGSPGRNSISCPSCKSARASASLV